jgi:hypothetical protein
MMFKTGEPVDGGARYNDDPVSRLLHPVVLREIATAGLEERRIVGALLLVWSVQMAENGDVDAARLSRRLGEAIRP